jgi:Zn-dependent peptidase ImmA (M78 family)/transcriptional regulator with XRE-family HTH domain
MADSLEHTPTANTNAWVAQQIRAARLELGWSQEQLARNLGRTQTAISYWESGRRSPGLDDLMDLAEVFDRSVDYFIPTPRRRPSIRALMRATAERLASSELAEILDDLVDLAEASGHPRRRFEITGTTPQRAAEQLLEQAKVAKAPVAIERLAAGCGVLVVTRPLPDSLSGLVFEVDDGAVIGVNESHHEHRQRFSIGHELGHWLLAHHDRLHFDIEAGHSATSDWMSERSANEFAAEVLMPMHLLRQEFTRTQDAGALADRFNVSQLAMGYRLLNAGLH